MMVCAICIAWPPLARAREKKPARGPLHNPRAWHAVCVHNTVSQLAKQERCLISGHQNWGGGGISLSICLLIAHLDEWLVCQDGIVGYLRCLSTCLPGFASQRNVKYKFNKRNRQPRRLPPCLDLPRHMSTSVDICLGSRLPIWSDLLALLPKSFRYSNLTHTKLPIWLPYVILFCLLFRAFPHQGLPPRRQSIAYLT